MSGDSFRHYFPQWSTFANFIDRVFLQFLAAGHGD